MLKRLAMGFATLLLLSLLALYVAGKGWFGVHVDAGEPTPIPRQTVDLEKDSESKRQAGRALGVARRVGSTKEILFGDFHVHTSFSADAVMLGLPLTGGTGTHTVSDACDFARYCSNLDFWSVNDHAESSTPRRWQETIEAIGRCDAVGRSEASEVVDQTDLISFVGWEWSHMGTTVENHFGHRNVIFRDLDADQLPTRPIASDSPADYFQSPSPLMLGLLPVIAGDSAYLRYATYQQENSDVERCPAGVSVRELPNDCREYAATPGDLLARLDDWGFDSLVIPHGTTWGNYTPPGSSYAKQLRDDFVDPVRQRLVEIYSGHGNTETYRDWRAIDRDLDGTKRCPMPRDDYLPACWQAGEIIRSRCLAESIDALECDARATLTRDRFLEAPASMGHLSVPGALPSEWRDAGQCRDCFLPAFSFRPLSSVQAMLAYSRESERGGKPLRFRFGFIGSSDNHTARPGTGYKEFSRTEMTDARLARTELPGPQAPTEPVAESRIATPSDYPPTEWLDRERIGSFFYTGGLVAVHAGERNRDGVWDALASRETYATSGPRILLWFDLLNPSPSTDRPPNAPAAMGSEIEMDQNPIFRVRAAGSRKQLPGCPESVHAALSEDRLARLCGGECFHPSDERRRITRIEIVRIRPQVHDDEDLNHLIEDPWRTFECDADPNGCVVTVSDPDYLSLGRDAVYYARAIEEPSDTVNGGMLRCEDGSRDRCERISPCAPGATNEEGCLMPTEHRAWSSPIFVDRPLF